MPDSDRWWVSGGVTYKYSEKMSFDLAYTHIFFDDAPYRIATSLTGSSRHFTGSADQSADIISVSMKNEVVGGHASDGASREGPAIGPFFLW